DYYCAIGHGSGNYMF
nr:immunoglobulin light chain junction region [Macaca mulatta]